MTEHQPPEVGRWVGMGEALARLALAAGPMTWTGEPSPQSIV